MSQQQFHGDVVEPVIVNTYLPLKESINDWKYFQ